jgi:hypothetical protein
LRLEEQCSLPTVPSFTDCVSANLLGVLESYGANLAYILAQIRAVYGGTLVLVNNYSPSADPLFTYAVFKLDSVMTEVGTPFGVKFADAFTAFQIASGGDPCAAGLLIRLSPLFPGCDVHPSPLGRDLIASTVIFAAGGK